MGCGCSCGSIRGTTPPAPPVSPLQVVPSTDVIAGWDAAVRVSVDTALFTLPDVSGNGFNLDQAVAVNQGVVVVGGGPNGNDSILFDGVNDFMANAALNLPPPGTTPLTYWAIVRQVTWTEFDIFWRGAIPGPALVQRIVTPGISQVNGATVNNNGALVLNTYTVVEALFTASTSDAIRIAGTVSTGVSAGNNDAAAGFFLATKDGLADFANIELCELWLFGTVLTVLQRAQLRAYATARYGAIP